MILESTTLSSIY